MPTIVILGAAGRVGDAAARASLAAGWRVRGVGRGARTAQMAPGVEPVAADAADRAALIDACRGADVILNALNPQYTEWADKVLPMAEAVLAAAEASGATHMLPGNVYNFGYGIGLDTAEDAAQQGGTEKGRIRVAMEALFARAAAERGVQTIVLRAGDFYGGRRPGSWLDLMILAKLKRDVFVWPGPMDVPHAFAYLPDLARAFVALAERRGELARFARFHFAGHTLTGAAMKAATERALGRPLARRGVPWTLLRAGGLFVPMLREVAAMAYLWSTPHSLDGHRLAGAVGTLPSTDPVAAIGQAVRDLALDGRAGTADVVAGARRAA
ncbi:NmrA family NAD(P)-binding protein [Aquibium sp. A9E412]|uniref:NmrA family NAD(P)-binding protein n=1 Tax=Aquibium sp. A9E412 TaxID=2976767 RepID=UPI0025B0E923|nr:NmrA family NAD(P)-binding protein [Aquibium sp. A9E412]MDN2567002.1 NmrA family NAD(P)-binding protein [Aquibium sp. A9E412]